MNTISCLVFSRDYFPHDAINKYVEISDGVWSPQDERTPDYRLCHFHDMGFLSLV